MSYPRVTILLPVLDEESFIDACLESLALQDYRGHVEVVVAEGGSTDRTRDKLEAWKSRLDLKVIENPRRLQSYGLNLAAECASGEILVRADAHTIYAPDYVRRSVEILEEAGATAVGGRQQPSRGSGFARAVAAAMQSPLAVGPAPFRHADEVREVDTVYLGAFGKADFERLGGYRTLPSGVAEDADLYFRWRSKGARILLHPEIRSFYTPRSTLAAHWRQYYRYGLGKADMLYVNGRWPSWRPLAPLLLVVGIGFGLVLGLFGVWWPLLTLLALWLVALVLASRSRPIVALAAGAMHLAYGLGLLRGLLRSPASVRADHASNTRMD